MAYNKHSRFSRNQKKTGRKKLRTTPEMQELIPTSNIELENGIVYIYNGREDPIEVNLSGAAIENIQMLEGKLVELFRVTEEDTAKWIGLLTDLLLNDESSEDEDDEQVRKSIHYIHKYSTGIPLAEAILIENTEPKFLHIIDGQAVLSKEITLPGNIFLRPLDKVSYLSKEYSFSSVDEINQYIVRAKKETPDSLYSKIKLEWKLYVDHDDIVICSADTYFSYFQDRLGMTHYLHFIGDNDVGKTSNLKVFEQIGYRPF